MKAWWKLDLRNCWQPISKDLNCVYSGDAVTFKNLPRPFVGGAKLAPSVQTRSKKFEKGERKAKFDLVHSNACSYCMERDWCSRRDEEQRNEEEDQTENGRYGSCDNEVRGSLFVAVSPGTIETLYGWPMPWLEGLAPLGARREAPPSLTSQTPRSFLAGAHSDPSEHFEMELYFYKGKCSWKYSPKR